MKAASRSNGRLHKHSPLATNDYDDEDDSYFKSAPRKLDYYSSDEDDRKLPAKRNLGEYDFSVDYLPTRVAIPPKQSEESFEDNDLSIGMVESFEYKGKRKKKWTQKEFMQQLEKNNMQTPSFFQGISKVKILIVAFAVIFAVGLFISTNKGGFEFHGLASASDDDDDYEENDPIMQDTGDTNKIPEKEVPPKSAQHGGSDSSTAKNHGRDYHFDQDAAMNQHDAFHVSDTNWYGGIFSSPPHPSIPPHLLHNPHDGDSMEDNIGYLQYPHIFNNTVVFCSEGDMYLTSISASQGGESVVLPAMRLTSTVGNVNTPKINPKYPYLVAFTATYSGHRELYLMDLRSNHRSKPSMRLTYTDSEYGVVSVIGWEDSGTSLVYSAPNREVAMEDQRLYKIGIVQEVTDNNESTSDNHRKRKIPGGRRLMDGMASPITVSSVKAIPLSQAIDSALDENSGCRYFTRFKQSSNTIRYVGGTAESIWAYCDGKEFAVPLTKDYVGTSKNPLIYSTSGKKYLLFLSDRAEMEGGNWTSTSMNLWAVPLPKKRTMYKQENTFNMAQPFVLTAISCIDGMQIQEFSADLETGNVVLRIGADLHIVPANHIKKSLGLEGEGTLLSPSKLPIAIYSDFNNLHERIIPLQNPKDVATIDVFDAGYGLVSTLMSARGQLFVNPVIENFVDKKDDPLPYGGGGMNMPHRRYSKFSFELCSHYLTYTYQLILKGSKISGCYRKKE